MEEAERIAANMRVARQQLDVAQEKLRAYDLAEKPLRLNRLDREIALVEAEIASFERRLVEYGQFTKFKYSAPLFANIEYCRLTLIDARLRLENLREERLAFIRFSPDERRPLAAAVAAAEQKLRDAAAGK